MLRVCISCFIISKQLTVLEKIFGDIRVRMVKYAPGFVADHSCAKGYILLCLEGEFYTELVDGTKSVLK